MITKLAFQIILTFVLIDCCLFNEYRAFFLSLEKEKFLLHHSLEKRNITFIPWIMSLTSSSSIVSLLFMIFLNCSSLILPEFLGSKDLEVRLLDWHILSTLLTEKHPAETLHLAPFSSAKTPAGGTRWMTQRSRGGHRRLTLPGILPGISCILLFM